MRRPSLRAPGWLTGITIVAAGCQLGARPTLGPAPAPTGDDAVEAVVAELTAGTDRAFTAEYTIRTPRGEETTAIVEQTTATERTVTIATTRYVVDETRRQTCETGSSACRPGLDPQPISLFAVTPEFFAASAVTRLRSDAMFRVGPSTPAAETIAGEPATCVTVPVADTASVFCALAGGPLARWRTTDVTIELVAFDAP